MAARDPVHAVHLHLRRDPKVLLASQPRRMAGTGDLLLSASLRFAYCHQVALRLLPQVTTTTNNNKQNKKQFTLICRSEGLRFTRRDGVVPMSVVVYKILLLLLVNLLHAYAAVRTFVI